MAAHKLGTLLLCSLLFCELTLVFSNDLPRRRNYNGRNVERNNHGDRHRSHNAENRPQRRHSNSHKEDEFDRHWDNFDRPNNFKGHRNEHQTPKRDNKEQNRFNHHKEEHHKVVQHHKEQHHNFKAPHKTFARPGPPRVIGPQPDLHENHRSTFHRNTFHVQVTSPRPLYVSPKKGRSFSRSYASSSSEHTSQQSNFQSGHPFSPSFSSNEHLPRYNPGAFQTVKKHTQSISLDFHQPTGYNQGHYHTGNKNVAANTQARSGTYYQPGSTLYQVKGSTNSHTFNTCGSALQYKGFCKSKTAGHYAHPASLDCYIQCDAWGSGYVRPCAPGTYWAHQGTGPAGFNACVSKKHGFKGNTATHTPKNNNAQPQNHPYTAVTRYYEHDPYGHGHGQGFY